MSKSNLPLGAEAVRAWVGAHDMKGKGDAIALRALLQADWHKERFARLTYKGKEYKEPFTLADYAFPPRKDDGSVDGVFRSAMLATILAEVFAVEGDAPNAVKQGFNRVYGAAVALRNMEEVSVTTSNVIKMPLGVAVKMADDNGKMNKRGEEIAKGVQAAEALNGRTVDLEAAFALAKGLAVDCDGKAHPMFGKMPGQTEAVALLKGEAIKRKLIAEPSKRQARSDSATDDGIKFTDSVAFIRSVLQEIRDTDEARVAFTDKMRHEMFGLASDLAAYFASEPMEEPQRKSA